MRRAFRKMIICLDVGNTNIKFAVYDGDMLKLSFRVATEHKKTSDEYGGQLLSILSNNGIKPEDISGEENEETFGPERQKGTAARRLFLRGSKRG